MELIVLNVGLQAKILDTRTFSMFVVHAIILTFMTTPLTLLFYPERFHVHVNSNKARDEPLGDDEAAKNRPEHERAKTKFAVILDKFDQLPGAMMLTQLLQPSVGNDTLVPVPRIKIDALRLIELTARTSAVLMSQEAESLMRNDPVISVFRTFGYLNRLVVSAALSVISYDQFPTAVADHARESDSDMVIVPWRRMTQSDDQSKSGPSNPFESFYGTSGGGGGESVLYPELVRKVFMHSPTDVALFVDRGIAASPSATGVASQHLFLPFFGGPDDRLALSFVVQLCSNPAVTATVVKMTKTSTLSLVSTIEEAKSTPTSPHQVSVSIRTDKEGRNLTVFLDWYCCGYSLRDRGSSYSIGVRDGG